MTTENRTYDELSVGDEATIERLCRAEDLYIFAHASGNHNPMHLPDADGDGDGVPEGVAPAMWVGSLISAVLGNILPGPGTLYLGQTFRFGERAMAGDTLKVGVRVREKQAERVVVLDTWVRHLDGVMVAEGVAEVVAPERKMSFDDGHIPGLTVQRHVHFDALLERARHLPPMVTAVAAPESPDSLEGPLLAAAQGLIEPVLFGDADRIRAVAREIGHDVSGVRIVDLRDHDRAAEAAVRMVHDGEAAALMKGHLHTDELLHHVVKRDGGLRGRRRLSHIFVMDVPGLDHLLLITDAAINIAPDLRTKVDIVQNAIDLAHALGIRTPKVGVLAAVETVNDKMPATLDAAVLAKMAERGQITGGAVDGPLAMDNALSMAAARTKGIMGDVAGRAEVLVAPDLQSGNMIAKQLTYLAHAEAGGIVMGARAPIILTSRSDDEKARLASCAIAVLYARWMARTRPPAPPAAAAARAALVLPENRAIARISSGYDFSRKPSAKTFRARWRRRRSRTSPRRSGEKEWRACLLRKTIAICAGSGPRRSPMTAMTSWWPMTERRRRRRSRPRPSMC
jgi:phosphate butyryltransferase